LAEAISGKLEENVLEEYVIDRCASLDMRMISKQARRLDGVLVLHKGSVYLLLSHALIGRLERDCAYDGRKLMLCGVFPTVRSFGVRLPYHRSACFGIEYKEAIREDYKALKEALYVTVRIERL
jgi:hypothetical protein